MVSMRILNKEYIMGMQADVTYANHDLDVVAQGHAAKLDCLIEEIFAISSDTWASLQAVSFGALKGLGVLPPGIDVPTIKPQCDELDYLKDREPVSPTKTNRSTKGT